MKKKDKKCKYCEYDKEVGGAMIVEDYDKREAKLYGEHLRHKHLT